MEKVIESHGISKAQKSTNPGGGGGGCGFNFHQEYIMFAFFPFVSR